MKEIRGVLVSQITGDDSPAEKAGIQPGDVIISLDGKPVDRVGQLQQEVGFRKPGDVVKVEVARKGGVRKTVDVRLEALPDSDLASATTDTSDAEGGDDSVGTTTGASINLLGVTVQAVTPSLAQQLGVPRTTKGVMVTDIAPGGPAYDLQLTTPAQGRGAADIIETVEGKPVRTEAELRAALKAGGAGNIVTLGIQRVYGSGQKPDHFVERVRLGQP
jgi:serine protease Do